MFGFRLFGAELLTATRQRLFLRAVGQKAVVANPHESIRKHMLQESADEFINWQDGDLATMFAGLRRVRGVIVAARAREAQPWQGQGLLPGDVIYSVNRLDVASLTELKAAIAAARQSFPGRRLVVAFQPHLYSRTRDQASAFGVALGHADVAVVLPIYPARAQPIDWGGSGCLAA